MKTNPEPGREQSIYTLDDFAELPPNIAKMRLEQANKNWADRFLSDKKVIIKRPSPKPLTLEEQSIASQRRILERFKK